MNWYKKSSIDDFRSGTIKDKLSTFPEKEEDLSEDQIRYLRSLPTIDMYVLDQTDIFRKYPKTVFYSIYQLEKYVRYRYGLKSWNEDIEDLMNKVKTYHPDHYPCQNMNKNYYLSIMSDPEGWKINEKFACDVFQSQQFMPDFFVQWFIERFPDIYQAKNSDLESKYQIIRDFISFGSNHDFFMMESMSSSLYANYDSEKTEKERKRKERDSFVESIYNTFLNYDRKESSIKRIIQRKKQNLNSYIHASGNEILNEVMLILDNYESKKSYYPDESQFSLFFINLGGFIGEITLLFFLQNKIKVESLHKIIETIGDDTDKYFKIEVQDENIILIKEDEGEKIVTVGEAVWIDRSYSSQKGQLETINSFFSPREKEEETLYWNWFSNELKKVKGTNKEFIFLSQVVESQKFKFLLETASQTLGALYISNANMISREDYDPSYNYEWSDKQPFILDLVNAIVDQIPPNLKYKISESSIAFWYVLCSGKFDCRTVYEKAMKYPSDVMKVIEHLSCSGTESEKIKDKIRAEASKLKQESRLNVKNKFIEFTNNPNNCTIASIKDFPNLWNYVIELISTHINGREKAWSYEAGKDMSAQEITLSRIEKCVIYIIDSNRIKSFFGEDNLRLAGISPSESNGIFFPRFNLSDDHDSIIVFSGSNDNERTESIINDILGLEPDYSEGNKISDVSQEGTLWHEVSHAVFYPIVSGEEAKTMSKWLRSPSELVAIQYGNLQYIKKKLRTFFENNIPASSKIEAGLLSHIEGEIIETFSWEFKGMKKEEALFYVRENIEDFREQISSTRESLTKEEAVSLLTDIFLEFFMGKMLRGKAETEIQEMARAIGVGEEEIKFKEEVKVPETYKYYSPGQKDEDILALESRSDYKQFIFDVKNRIEEYKKYQDFSGKERIKFYLHKSDGNSFREPMVLTDLVALIFEPPSSLLDVDLTRTNRLFDDIIPPSLKHDVIDLVENKRKQFQTPIEEKDSPVSADEAEETGKFMVEMDREYGKDWMWTAGSRNWYKKAVMNLRREDI